ncbi:hypothetical protein [Rhodopila sp.]|uniref:hypothetical protein n=1 Tax=Rhodopila sp. TaxID=2480087 RepID=UPI002C4142D7|nr:hypothetical protein [Rhodopila sp.]HVZ10662.1 hypothetical protein [Rhodopila sp.]
MLLLASVVQLLRRHFAHEHHQHRIVLQLVVVDQIFLAERDPNPRCITSVSTER